MMRLPFLLLSVGAPLGALGANCKTETVKVHARDGLLLNTLVVRPTENETSKLGTVFIQTPYGAKTTAIFMQVWQYCLDGFIGVIQDDRGSAMSPGRFHFFGGTGTDGYDTIEWIVQQPWSNGKVATTGGSALGISQYTLLINPDPGPHPALKAVNPVVAEGFGHQLSFPGGAYRSGLTEMWLASQSDLEDIPENKANEAWSEFWKNTSGSWAGPDGVSGFDRARRHAAWGVHMAGWYDIFSTLQIETVNELSNTDLGATAPQWFIVEPTGHCVGGAVQWTNVTFGNSLQTKLTNAMFALRIGDPTPSRAKELQATLDDADRLTFYVTGPGTDGSVGNFWVGAPAWPKTTSKSLYLSKGGDLTPAAPAKSSLEFVYDPAKPVKTWGGNNLIIQPCGPQDQRKVDGDRSDVLIYEQSEVLSEPLVVVGNVTAELSVGSNASDTDFVVKMVDVWPDGTRMLVQDGIQRMRWRSGPYASKPSSPMTPGSVYDILVVVGGVSHVFNAGHRIGLTITSSNAPKFQPNPNTGEPLSQNSTAKVVARNAVWHGKSRLLLPVAEGLLPPTQAAVMV